MVDARKGKTSRSLSPENKERGKAWKRLLRRHRHHVNAAAGNERKSTSSAPNSPLKEDREESLSNRPLRSSSFDLNPYGSQTNILQQSLSRDSLNSTNHYDGVPDDGDNVTIEGQESHDSTDSNEVRKVAFVWKKKSGVRGKFKQGYALASEGANYLKFKSSLTKGTKDGTTKHTGIANGGIMWEKRKLVLDHTMLMYFDINADVEDASVLEDPYMSIFEKVKHKLKWTEQADVNVDNNNDLASSSAINTPRGAIDLLTTHATVYSVSTESYHSPTPYVLYIITKYESKWAVCFETADELLNWQRMLSNVTLKQSEARYKKEHGMAYCPTTSRQMNREDGSFQTPPNKNAVAAEQDEISDDLSRKLSERISSMSPLATISRMPSTVSVTLKSKSIYIFAFLVNAPVFSLCFLSLSMPMFIKSLCILLIANFALYFGVYNSMEESKVGDVDSVQSIPDQNSLRPPVQNIHFKSEETPSFTQQLQMTPRSVRNTSIESTRLLVASIKNLVTANDCDESSAFKPVAGSTTVRLDTSNEARLGQIGWVSRPPSSVTVRGENYMDDRKKVQSPGSLYELIKVDAFDADTYITEIGKKVILPDTADEINGQKWLAPEILIVSFALPTAIPKLGRTSTDLRGYIVTGYYRMRQETKKVLRVITNPQVDTSDEKDRLQEEIGKDYQKIVNGVRLWETWCREAPSDPEMQKRLKFIPKGENLRELGVPSWICKYNGKPMLIKRPGVTGFLYSYPEQNAMEIGISLHPFPYMFKQAMTYLRDNYFPKMLMTFSFVIEGRNEEELPEVLLGNPILLPYVDTESVLHADDVFTE